MLPSLRYVLLLQRDVPKATDFYSRGLGLAVDVITERWAELRGQNVTLALKAVEGYAGTMPIDGRSDPSHPHREAYTTTGYSPMLVFNVADLQERVTTMLQMGASLDGAIQYTVEGKVGHNVGNNLQWGCIMMLHKWSTGSSTACARWSNDQLV